MSASTISNHKREMVFSDRALANQAFSRAAGAPLIPGNSIRLLKDAGENYPAWLEAIRSAKRHIHFESYIVHEDDTGRMFADALIAKAQEGIRVSLIYDWLGGFGTASRGFWDRMRASGVEVRCYNPARWDSPFGWLSRDHRKTLTVDGERCRKNLMIRVPLRRKCASCSAMEPFLMVVAGDREGKRHSSRPRN